MKRVRWRKRLLAAMCAMMCLLGLSVQAFASIRNVSYADAAAELKRYFPLLEGTTDTCVLNVSFENSSVANLEEAKEAWKMVMGEWLNDPEYTVLFAMQTSPVTVYACKTSNFSGWSGSGSSRSANFSGDFYEFSFYTSRDTGGIFPLNRFVHSSNGGQVSSFVSPNTVWYKSAAALASRSDCPGAVGIYQDINTIVVRDDIQTQEPDPPSSSSEPDPIPPLPSEPDEPWTPAGPPDFGEVDSEYLPYDSSVFESLMWYLRDVIGSAGRVILLIVFLLTVVPLIRAALKHALGKNDDHGGGLI